MTAERPTPIRRLLVANRAEIALRVMRTANAMGIATVAVHSEPDREAPFVAAADLSFALGGASPADSYLRADLILDAALATGADAIHPGYGFLAENAEFAAAVIDAGLVWVGPPPKAIEEMGSKIRAKELMSKAGVPLLADAVVEDGSDVAAAGAEVGFPLLVKASAGGGGKGMRIVEEPDNLESAVAAAQREAASAFGDGTVFLERYVAASRHVEIQLLADSHGNTVSLFERECSIQRRHQKILEESPSPVLSDELRARMGEAAVAAGKAIDYVGAGTVEFLLDGEDFYFLEVNTRLQVEHPVTEAITGLDLVRCQLEIATGAPMPGAAADPSSSGHAIEVRVYAEDPAADFMPAIGRLERFSIPEAEGVRIDSGVESGSEVGVHYDPMLAKVIAHAATREEAAARLARTLRRAQIHGLRTNRELLVRLLEHPEFLEGTTDTGFLERHDPAELGAPLLDGQDERACAAAAALADQAMRRDEPGALRSVPSGWRNNRSALQSVIIQGSAGPIEVGYGFGREGTLAELSLGGDRTSGARLHGCSAERVDLELDGVRRTYRVNRAGALRWVNTADGQAELTELPRYPSTEASQAPGSLLSPMPGSVLRVAAGEGDRVEAGTALIVIEAMKMEQEIVAPASGRVAEMRVAVGDQVDSGSILAVIEADSDPDAGAA